MDKAIESFINTCDEMMIAEESIQSTLAEIGFTAGILAVAVLISKRQKKIKEKEEAAKKKEEVAKRKAADETFKTELADWVKRTNADFKNRESVGNRIQKELMVYLKGLRSSKEYAEWKVQMDKAMDITISQHSDFGVQISEWQSGEPYDEISRYIKEHPGAKHSDLPKELTDNGWYYKMLSDGEKFVENKFAYEFQFYGFSIDTGDGDEATIYIN